MTNVLPDLGTEPELTEVQRLQLDRGLTVITTPGTQILADALAVAYDDFIQQHMPATPEERYRFSYVSEDERDVFDSIGIGLFHSLQHTLGYRLRTGQGDVVESRGFILYPPNDAGTPEHSDQFLGDTLVRVGLSVAGEGNFWSIVTGPLITKAGSLLVQDLTRSPLHRADTRGFRDARAFAFWDIPADRAAF